MFEKISLIGRLGKDPEMRHTRGQEPIPVTNFSIAVNRKDSNGNEQTKWFDISAWRGLAGPCAEYLSKGSLVYVEGTVQARAYTDNSGEARASLQVNANIVKFLQTDNQNQNQNSGFGNNGFGNSGLGNGGFGEISDDDIPF